MVTAGGLVFQGNITGEFAAFDAKTGDKLWSVNIGLGISAPPVTYEVESKQYVSLLAGFGGNGVSIGGGTALQQFGWSSSAQARQLLTFAPDASNKIPEAGVPVVPETIVPADFGIDDKLVEAGTLLYVSHRAICHSSGAVSGGYAPDLRASPIMLSTKAMKSVIIDGAKVQLYGMPSFPEFKQSELVALRHFVRSKALASVTESEKQ